MHAHIWEKSVEKHKTEILKACDLYAIDTVLVCGMFDRRGPENFHNPEYNDVEKLNKEVYKFKNENPKLIEGIAYINPLHIQAFDELDKCINEYGFKAMKLKPPIACDDKRIYPLVEKCILYNIPLLICTWHNKKQSLCQPDNIARLAARYPESRICMAHHGGGDCYRGMKPVIKLKNVWTDIAGSMNESGVIEYMIEKIGVERILFGSDMPGSFLLNLGKVEDLNISSAKKEQIFYRNTLRWLGEKNECN